MYRTFLSHMNYEDSNCQENRYIQSHGEAVIYNRN